MPAPDAAVRVEGLAQLRRDLRNLGPDAVKEIRVVIKDAAGLVAREAATLAPRKTGALAAAIRATTSGDKGVVRDPLPYAAVQHYGGTIRPKGSPVVIRPTLFITRALERQQDKIVDALGDGIDKAARRNGWH